MSFSFQHDNSNWSVQGVNSYVLCSAVKNYHKIIISRESIKWFFILLNKYKFTVITCIIVSITSYDRSDTSRLSLLIFTFDLFVTVIFDTISVDRNKMNVSSNLRAIGTSSSNIARFDNQLGLLESNLNQPEEWKTLFFFFNLKWIAFVMVSWILLKTTSNRFSYD